MTELTNALYEFLTEHYIHSIIQNPDYEKAVEYAETKQQLLSSQLDEEQRRLLQGLLGEIHLAHTMEKIRLFQATLALSRELNRLMQS